MKEQKNCLWDQKAQERGGKNEGRSIVECGDGENA